MSTVYFVPLMSAAADAEVEAAIGRLVAAAGLAEIVRRNDLTAVKLHVGEPGTTTFVQPRLVAGLVGQLKALGSHPFLTDTAVLYKSPRNNAVTHAAVAHAHGFGIEAVGAPFIPADGLNGSDEVVVAIEGGKHFKEVAVAAGIVQARSVVVLSHVTGHLGTGFAATLKNLAMGCCSRKAKLRQHSGHIPKVLRKRCVACGVCVAGCPEEAIDLSGPGGVASIAAERCIGCGECVALCRDDAIGLDWDVTGPSLQERIVEHALGVVRAKAGRIFFLTVAQNMTKDCDCMGLAQQPVVGDLGLFAGTDPVAVDQAVATMIEAVEGRSFSDAAQWPQIDGGVQLAYGESLGLGSRQVNLVSL